jgi:hypothetical protein
MRLQPFTWPTFSARRCCRTNGSQDSDPISRICKCHFLHLFSNSQPLFLSPDALSGRSPSQNPKLFVVFDRAPKEQSMFMRHWLLPHQKHPMFSKVLTGTPHFSRVVHGLLLIDKLKTLSIFSNSISSTPIPANRIKGFTGLISISYNKTKGPHGFTGPAPYSPPMGSKFKVQSSKFKVQSSVFSFPRSFLLWSWPIPTFPDQSGQFRTTNSTKCE